MSEWLKEHAWKVCIRQRIEGSNPSLTATKVNFKNSAYRAIPLVSHPRNIATLAPSTTLYNRSVEQSKMN